MEGITIDLLDMLELDVINTRICDGHVRGPMRAKKDSCGHFSQKVSEGISHPTIISVILELFYRHHLSLSLSLSLFSLLHVSSDAATK